MLASISLFRTCVVNWQFSWKVTPRMESALVCDIHHTRGKTRVQPFFLEIEVKQFFDGSHLQCGNQRVKTLQGKIARTTYNSFISNIQHIIKKIMYIRRLWKSGADSFRNKFIL